MLTEEHIKLAKETLESHRDGVDLSRWAFMSIKDTRIVEKTGYVCVAGLNRSIHWSRPDNILLFSFNGESPKNTRGYGEYVGGELSKKWLQFLLGPDTPFPDVVSFIHNKDEIDWINESGGFIFSPGYLEVGAGQLRGFLILSRYAQEQHSRCLNWSLMVEHLAMDPMVAFILSTTYTFAEGWLLSEVSYSGHSVFYEPPGLYAKNFYERKFPFDKKLSEGALIYCTDSLFDKKGEAYQAYLNAWTFDSKTLLKALYFDIEIGDNAKQASEKLLKGIKGDGGDGNE